MEEGVSVLGLILVVLASFTWALDTLLRYPLLGQGIQAERIVFTEHLFLVLMFVPFLLKDIKKFFALTLGQVFRFFVIGVLGSAMATLAFTKAFSLLNPTLVILLQKLQPLVAISLAHFYLQERVKKEFIFFAILAILGALLLSWTDLAAGFQHLSFSGLLSNQSILGYALTLFSVLCWGSATVFGKKLTLEGFSTQQLMGGRFFFGFIFLSFYLMANSQNISFAGPFVVWGKILAMVLLSGAIGMYLYYQGLKKISARLCAIAELFFPLSAVMINWFFLGQSLSMIQMIGAIILVVSSTILQLRHY